MNKTTLFYDEDQQVRLRTQALARYDLGQIESSQYDTGMPYDFLHDYILKFTGLRQLEPNHLLGVAFLHRHNLNDSMSADLSQMHFANALISDDFLDVAKTSLFKKRKNVLEHEEEFLCFFDKVCQLIFTEDDMSNNVCTNAELDAYIDFFDE